MYQKNLKNYYNRYYGRGKAAALNHSLTKKMLEDSEDEYISEKLDRDSLAKEQKFASVMFLVTIAILLVKLFELATTSQPHQWLSAIKFPEFRMDWSQDGGDESLRLVSPALWGIGVAAMTWIITYFDSKVPGENPRAPSLKQLSDQKQWSFSYCTTVLCGFFVFLTMVILQL